MTEPFAQFLAACGHRVVQTDSAYWYDASRWVFLSAPSHHLIDPSDAELRALFRRPCLGIRYTAPVEARGKLSYQLVCDDRGYRLEALSANTRSKVRRGLRRCEIRPVPFGELAVMGRAADRDTLDRQGRGIRLAGARWARFWQAAAATPGMQGWGAFVGGDLAGFLVTVRFGETVDFLLARSRNDHLDAYPNNALIFSVVEELLARAGVREITFGLESLEPVAPLDQFKFSMGFRARPLRQCVRFHPLLRPVLRHPVVRAAVQRRANRPGPRDVVWRKAAGLLRFAEEGGFCP
jgi:hypothetical protein